MTEYCLDYLITGKAKKAHLALTKEISGKFNILDVGKRTLPHLTIKYLGDIRKKSELNCLLDFIKKVAKAEKFVPIDLKGFSNFGKDVIFVDVKTSKKLDDFYDKVYAGLIELKFVEKLEKVEGKNMHFHATLCAQDINKNFEEIFNFLKTRIFCINLI